MADKMAITVFTGCVDKLNAMAYLVFGAVALEMDVEIFLHQWGIYAFRKDIIKKNNEFSEFKGMQEKISKRFKELGKSPWYELFKRARGLGNVKVYACSAMCEIWNVKKEELEFVDEIIGVAEWIDRCSDAKITLFI